MANDLSPDGAAALFHPATFLAGTTTARGFFEDRFGRVRRDFLITIVGGWQGDTFVLDETFVYGDGARETRQWRIVDTGHGSFTATCADCVGSARGECHPGWWRMRYNFRLKLGRRVVVVSFDDRVHRTDAGTAVNRATVRKWGLRLGEIVIVMHKRATTAEADSPHYAMAG